MGLSPEEYRKTIGNYPLEKRILISADFDLTITEDFQQLPILEANFENIKKAYDGKIFDGRKIEINEPLDWFKLSDAWAEPHNGVAWVSQLLYNMQNGIIEPISKNDFQNKWAPKIRLSPGVPQFISELREEFQGKCYIGFYIVSVGITDLILGTDVGKIADGIYASDLVSLQALHNSNGINGQYSMPVDAARDIIRPFGKTECIIKIAKGNSKKLDDLVRNDDLKYSYSNIIYLGDGTSDVSMFAYLQKKGSTLVCVYEEGNMAAFEHARTNPKLMPRINAFLPRDYQASSPTYDHLGKIINRMLSRKCRFPSQALDLEKKRRLDSDCDDHKGLRKVIKSHVKHCNECRQTYSVEWIPPK